MTFKAGPAGEPAPEPVERDDVRITTNRCPFCHDDVSIEEADWVSCRQCQARHHRACWEESAGCGSCGDTRFLTEATATPTLSEPAEEPAPRPRRDKARAAAAALCFVVCLALVVADVVAEVIAVDSAVLFALILAGLVVGMSGKLTGRRSA